MSWDAAIAAASAIIGTVVGGSLTAITQARQSERDIDDRHRVDQRESTALVLAAAHHLRAAQIRLRRYSNGTSGADDLSAIANEVRASGKALSSAWASASVVVTHYDMRHHLGKLVGAVMDGTDDETVDKMIGDLEFNAARIFDPRPVRRPRLHSRVYRRVRGLREPSVDPRDAELQLGERDTRPDGVDTSEFQPGR